MKYSIINIYRPNITLFFNSKAYLNKSNIEEIGKEIVNKYLYPPLFSDSDKITILKPLVSFIPKIFFICFQTQFQRALKMKKLNNKKRKQNRKKEERKRNAMIFRSNIYLVIERKKKKAT